MEAESSKERVSRRRKEFTGQHGYQARHVPEAWIGREVLMNVLSGRGKDALLGVVPSSGVLEAVREDGYVISAGDRVFFFSKESVLQMEPHDEGRPGTAES